MFAIIESGGKQFKVQKGDVIYVEKLDGQAGDALSFERVLMVVDGDKATCGQPMIEGAKVSGTLAAQVKGEKIIVYKYKAKKNCRRKAGHRQPYTKVEITDILMA